MPLPEKRRTAMETMAAEAATAAVYDPTVIVVGINNSEEAFYALRWTLRRHFSTATMIGVAPKLIVVYAKPIPSSAISIGGLGSVDVLPSVESNLSKIAATVIEEAQQLCIANEARDVVFEVGEGEASTVLCHSVEEFQADMLVLGSCGHKAIKRAVMGSVKDFCVRHAQCSVMVVKKPTLKK